MMDILEADGEPASGPRNREASAPAPRTISCRGLEFPADSGILPRRTRQSLRNEGYENKEADAVLKLIRDGDVVIELGGGIGFMSTLIAKKTGARSVHSFEANPKLIPYIRQVHEMNGADNAEVTNAVLGLRESTTTFYIRKNFLSSSLDPLEGEGVVGETQIDVLDANAVIERIKPSVLVCDIEGAEADLLPMLDLSSLRAVLLELHPQWIGKSGVRAVFQAMNAAGLVFFPRWSVSKVACFRRDW